MKAALSVASTRIIETITTLGRTDDHKKAEATNLETEQRTVRATTLTRYTYTPPPTPGDIYIVLEKTDRSNKIDFAIQWAGWKESGSRDVGDSEGLILKLKHNNHDDFPIKLNTNATRLVFKQYPKDDGPDQLDQDYDKEDL
ncbi:MAG: hypothetical protein QNJ55_07915 [Xenococcus sp. MO_188.B8]|nr:hypothetical protein [Xenococcus sp. MO_188.B8]